MSDQPDETPEPEESEEQVERPAPRRRARPEQTRDDTDAGWGESGVAPSRGKREGSGDREDDARARWLRAERPPHWG